MSTSNTEEFVLQHARQPYDPKKRREYYLRTRRLKGRQSAGLHPSSTSRPSAGKPGTNRPAHKKPKNLLDRKRQRELRAQALRVKLDKLLQVLRELVEDAKRRSGVEVKPDKKPEQKTTAESKTSKSKERAKKSEPKTATEKAKARKASREYYEENKTGLSGANATSSTRNEIKLLQRDIQDVQKKIARARAKLKKPANGPSGNVASMQRPAAKSRQPS